MRLFALQENPQTQLESKSELQQLALAGSASAQCALALQLLDEGKSDFQEIAYWLTLAADNDNALAQLKLSALYSIGRGVQKNLDTARKYYERFMISPEAEEIGKKYPYDLTLIASSIGGIRQPFNRARISLRSAMAERFSTSAALSCLAFFQKKYAALRIRQSLILKRRVIISCLSGALTSRI